jgi:hypothetical protein
VDTYDVYFWKGGMVVHTEVVKAYSFTSALITAEAAFLMSPKKFESVQVSRRMTQDEANKG